MNSRADAYAQRSQRVPDGTGSADGTGWTIEDRQEPVARGIDLTASEALQPLADERMMLRDEFPPAAVTKLGRMLGGADDVREQHRDKHTIRFRPVTNAGEELLDLVENGIRIASPRCVVDAR